MSAIKSVEQATADALDARMRLMETLDDLQQRVAPSRLMEDTLNEVRTRSADLVHQASAAARKRPAAVAGAAAGAALLIAHKPLWRLGRRLLGRQETPKPVFGLSQDAKRKDDL